jgi:hypothetical protein
MNYRDSEIMTDEELLVLLKNEATLATAKANGAHAAYREHALHIAQKKLSKANIYRGDKIRIAFTNGDQFAIFADVHFSIYDKEPTLYGRFITKRGKLASIPKSELCGISYFGNVSKEVNIQRGSK